MAEGCHGLPVDQDALDGPRKASLSLSLSSLQGLDLQLRDFSAPGGCPQGQSTANTRILIKDQAAFHDFIQKHVKLIALPPIEQTTGYIKLRYAFFTVYRRLFSAVMVGNLVALGLVLKYRRTTTALVTAAAANLVVCGLARLPYVVNAMYLVVVGAIPRSAPLLLRRIVAKISHYGGVHSGCGLAAVFWYICYVVLLARDYSTLKHPRRPHTAVVVLSFLVLALLLSMIAVAYPTFRFMQHNAFELTHRFSSWALVLLFWCAYIVTAHNASNVERLSLGSYLVRDPTFWLAITLTISVILPWLTLRQVAVSSEYLSDHAVRLHFDFTTTRFAQGVSVSRDPLGDWHSFAGIPHISRPGFSIVISNAGDWTSACIRNPPRYLWKRGVPVYGFGRSVSLFQRALVVVTGSGIGPCLSLLASKDRPPLRILWQTRNPRETYGDGILEALQMIDSNAVIIDTDKYGRQDMMVVAWSMMIEFSAEAVYVISRPKVVFNICQGFEARSVPAYGPVFDS